MNNLGRGPLHIANKHSMEALDPNFQNIVSIYKLMLTMCLLGWGHYWPQGHN